MKKFFSYGVVAIAAFAMVSCGNKAGNASADKDSTATEQVAEAPSTFAENEFFSVTGPDGWEVKADDTWKKVGMEDVNSTETFKPKINIRVYEDKKLQEKIDYLLKGGDTY